MRVWIDLANSPHVLLFRPIVAEMEERGHEVGLTARDFAQTVSLAEDLHLRCDVIGRHGGRGRGRKAANIAGRALALGGWARRWCADVAVSHNSYSQALAAWSAGIPAVTMMDYEGQPANHTAFRLAARVILPEAFPEAERRRQGAWPHKTKLYAGLKEQLYLWDAPPDPDFRQKVGLAARKTLVVLRPPATMALYHAFDNPLFDEVVDVVAQNGNHTQVVILPRTPAQAGALADRVPPEWIMPKRPFHGPSLLAAADVVIGAGGTMNREAAVMGTPVYSVYAGKPAAVDRWLVRRGLMTLVESREQAARIPLKRKDPAAVAGLGKGRELMNQVVDWILEVGETNEKWVDDWSTGENPVR